MSGMIERVAKAMADKVDQLKESYLKPEDRFTECARAAIEAMRDPTDTMVDGGIRNGVDNGFGCGYDEYVELWQAMIDEALK